MEKCTQQWLKKILFEPTLSHIQFLLLSSIYYYYTKNLKKSDAIQNQVLQMSYTLGLPFNFKSNSGLKAYEAYLTWVVVCSFRWETKGFKYLPDNFPESPIPQHVFDHSWQINPSIFGDHATLLGQCIAQKIQFEVELNLILLTNLNQIQLGDTRREACINQKSQMIQKLSDKYTNYFNLIMQYYPHLSHQILKTIILDLQFKLETIQFLLQSDASKLKTLLKLEDTQQHGHKLTNYLVLLKLIHLSSTQNVQAILKPNLNVIKRLMGQLNQNTNKQFYLKLVLFKFYYRYLK
jgi:hypothetical protein